MELVTYTEHGSKNRPGGSHQLNLNNKCINHYVRPDLGDRCHVKLLKLYLSKLPKVAFEKDIFIGRNCLNFLLLVKNHGLNQLY